MQTVEAYTSRFATDFTDALTERNISLGVKALRGAVEKHSTNDIARLAWVSLSSGIALSNSGLGAAHGLASVLGSYPNAAHGALCGRLLAPVLEKNLSRAGLESDAFTRVLKCIQVIGKEFEVTKESEELLALEGWLREYELPRLRDFGVNISDFEHIAKQAMNASSTQKNAVELTKQDVQQILEAAY